MAMENLAELIQLQKETIEYLKQMNETQQKQIELQNQTIAGLNETIEFLKRKLFGSSSEKSGAVDLEGQLSFFNEAEQLADPSQPEPSLETVVEGYKRESKKPKATREEILAGLPVVEIICSITDENKTCPWCNTELEPLGKQTVREELRIIPAKLERIRYVQLTYLCPQCKEDGQATIIKAETPSPLLKHSLASPSTVAYVMYQKYVNALPLYRQEKDWLQMGVKLPRATLANWIIKCGMEYLKPVYELLHKHLLDREVAHADETTCQVLKEDGKKANSKSYMWLYRTGNDELEPIVLYDYQPTRGGYHAVEFLKGFQGFLHCDGFAGYNKLNNVTRCGCWAHYPRSIII